jgi:hypothetical protein
MGARVEGTPTGGLAETIVHNRAMDWLGELWHYPMYASVWGTAGQWVSSVLTGGSLFLAFKIMRTNQKDKRREQASLVVFTNYYTSTFGEEDMTLIMIRGTIHNHSSSLVTNAAIVIEMTKRTARQRLSFFDRCFRPHKKTVVYHNIRIDDDITGTVLPDAETSYMIEVPYDEQLTAGDVVIKLSFMDANSVEWDRPHRGAPEEPKLPGRIRTALITWLKWRDWEKANPDVDESLDPPEGDGPKALEAG